MSEVAVSQSLHSKDTVFTQKTDVQEDPKKEDDNVPEMDDKPNSQMSIKPADPDLKVVSTGSIVQVKDETNGQVIEAVVIDQEELNKLKGEQNDDNMLNLDNKNNRNVQSAQEMGSKSDEVARQPSTQSENVGVEKRKQSAVEKVFESLSKKLSKASATLSNKSKSSKKEDKNKDEYTYEYTYAEVEDKKAPNDDKSGPADKAAPSTTVKRPSGGAKAPAKPVTKAPVSKPTVPKTNSPAKKAPAAKPAVPKTNSPPPQTAPAGKKRKDSLFKRFMVKIKVWKRKKKPSQSN